VGHFCADGGCCRGHAHNQILCFGAVIGDIDIGAIRRFTRIVDIADAESRANEILDKYLDGKTECALCGEEWGS